MVFCVKEKLFKVIKYFLKNMLCSMNCQSRKQFTTCLQLYKLLLHNAFQQIIWSASDNDIFAIINSSQLTIYKIFCSTVNGLQVQEIEQHILNEKCTALYFEENIITSLIKGGQISCVEIDSTLSLQELKVFL